MNQQQESYLQSLFSRRLGGENFGKGKRLYKFEKIKRAKRETIQADPEVKILDLGVGEPDEMAAPEIAAILQRECARQENRFYADNGIEEFKEAAVKYMSEVFGVRDLDPVREVLHAIGAKSALAMFPALLINPGDVVLNPVPGYPILATQSRWQGAEVVNLPLLAENNFLPDLASLTRAPEQRNLLKRAKLLYLNYPNNPTGAAATRKFYSEVIEFARENKLVVVQDAAYAALTFQEKPLSFLSLPGAKEVGVEIHSLSKSFNMTGWRIAFVAGNPLLIKGFAYVKDNFDSGQFIAIQKAAIYALNHPEISKNLAAKYERRLRLLVDTFNSLGFEARMPPGTFYLYVKIPRGVKNETTFVSAESFSEYLIRKQAISCVPWDEAGHFVRFSATFKARGAEEEKELAAEIKRRLSSLEFIW